MKFLVLLGIAFAILKVEARPTDSISEDTPDVILDTIHQAITCGREIGPEAEELQQLQSEGILPEDNESFNAYFGCIWQKKGIINGDAEVDPNNLRRYLMDLFAMDVEVTAVHESLANSVMDQCENVQGKDYGQKAVKINNCVLKQLYKLLEDKN